MTGIELQALAERDPKKVAIALAATLKDFGYPITPDHVEGYLRNFKAGTPPKGGPEMFVHGWLTKGMEE